MTFSNYFGWNVIFFLPWPLAYAMQSYVLFVMSVSFSFVYLTVLCEVVRSRIGCCYCICVFRRVFFSSSSCARRSFWFVNLVVYLFLTLGSCNLCLFCFCLNLLLDRVLCTPPIWQVAFGCSSTTNANALLFGFCYVASSSSSSSLFVFFFYFCTNFN